MRRYVIPALAGLALVGVAGCSPDAGDFAGEAEDFIEDEDDDVAQNTGETFTDASCDEPDSTDEGTMFTCTATASNGSNWDFRVEITGSNSFTVAPVSPTTAGPVATTPTGSGTTVPESTTTGG